jgi:integrase
LNNLTELVGHVPVSTVTTEQIKAFVFKDGVGDTTRINNLTMLSVFFNWCRKHGYATFNPVQKIERPRKIHPAPKVMTPDEFQVILDRCLKKGWKERVAVLSLIGFAGMRRAEACRLTWADIDLKDKKVMLDADKSKIGAHRRNDLPANAVAWLTAVYDARRTGPLIVANADMLLRTALRCKGVKYHQNALRHSFCSYYLEKHGPKELEQLIADMGHGGGAQMIHRHYRNLVPKGSGKAWFAISPPPPKPAD